LNWSEMEVLRTMTDKARWIEVRDVPDPPGYIIVNGNLSYMEGLHPLWNYEQVKEGRDFKKYVKEGKIMVKPLGWKPNSS
jgi:hypothetical protein